MKTAPSLVLTSLVLAGANLGFLNAQPQNERQILAQAGESSRTHNLPQDFVVCTGWHALCTSSPDCKLNGDKADCDCLRVNETHVVETNSIQDTEVKRMTQVKCTSQHPCAVDQAPVCKAIQSGEYEVNYVKYGWVSTFSYRGWCSLQKVPPKACVPESPGYIGDSSWALCDAAPCTEIQNPSNPDKPLSCRCVVVQKIPFLGLNGTCTGDNGGIMSSYPLESWDFTNNTYRIPIPGLEYVNGACAALKSDPLPTVQSGIALGKPPAP